MSGKIDIRGVKFDNVDMNEAVSIAKELIAKDGFDAVFTPNSEIVQACIENESLFEIINSASLIIPDGIGVVYASKILKTPLKEKVAGIELAEKIAEHIALTGDGLFLFGGAKATESSKAVCELAAEKLKEKYKGLVISGVRDGFFSESDTDSIIEQINSSGAKVLFVCLGAPKQEKFIYDNRERLKVSLAAGLGGSLDVFSGTVNRAPGIFIKFNLEWLYRLIKMPSRFGRMMKIPKFLFETKFRAK